MRRILAVVSIAAVATAIACAPSSPPSTSTKPAAAPTAAPAATKAPEATKPAEATKAPTAAPAAAPAKKVDFPTKGQTITIIMPYAAGGATDVALRALLPYLEKELGTPVQILNKVGAGGQVGLTELARSKPDGYTLGGINLPGSVASYLDPEMKSIYTRKSFLPVAVYVVDPGVMGVSVESRFKTLKDLVDEAKAKPETVKMGSGAGMMSATHLAIISFERAAAVKLAIVQFDGGGQMTSSIMGGHVDGGVATGGNFATLVNSGKLRALALMGSEESAFFPGVKTMKSMGHNVDYVSYFGIAVPAGTPQEIIDILGRAFKKATEAEDVKKRMEGMSMAAQYIDAAEFSRRWDAMDIDIGPLISIAREQK